jgi:hypothetical protein
MDRWLRAHSFGSAGRVLFAFNAQLVLAKVQLVIGCDNGIAGVLKLNKAEDIEGTVSILLVHNVCLNDFTILREETVKVVLFCSIGEIADVDGSGICSGPGITSDSGDWLLLVVGLTTFNWFEAIGELNAVRGLVGEDAFECVSAVEIECEANIEPDGNFCRRVAILVAEN